MKMVHAALRIDFGFISARSVGELRAGDDVEVVVGGVPACVAFCADCCTKDYKVFCDASMNNIHSTHRAPCIIKNPLLLKINVPSRKLLAQLARDKRYHSRGVITMSGDGAEREIVEIGGVEDVEPVEVGVEELADECQQCEDDGCDDCLSGE